MDLRKISHNGVETAYRDTGGDGVPFLLVHGFTGSMLDFEDELEQLSKDRRVILMDQRGHGASSNTGRPEHYRVEALVDDLLSFINAVELTRADILGHSLGGMVVMRAVLTAPELFRSVVLMDTSAEPLKDEGEAPFPEKLYGAIREQGVQIVMPGIRGRTRPPAETRGVAHLGEDEHFRRLETKLSQMDPEAFIGLMANLKDQVGVLDRLDAIACPTTVLFGDDDLPFIEPSRLMHKRVVGSKLAEIPTAAHSPQYENAPAWRSAIAEHLDWADSLD